MRDLQISIAHPVQTGFTLVEALVAMAIFMIGFSGLYFSYSLARSVISDAERRVGLNLMAHRIVQTIAAEGQRAVTDPQNPFANPSAYSGSLRSCNYSSTDDRQGWCVDLANDVGPYNAASGKEERLVDVVNDGTGLIVNITLIIANGSVSTYYSRKLRQL